MFTLFWCLPSLCQQDWLARVAKEARVCRQAWTSLGCTLAVQILSRPPRHRSRPCCVSTHVSSWVSQYCLVVSLRFHSNRKRLKGLRPRARYPGPCSSAFTALIRELHKKDAGPLFPISVHQRTHAWLAASLTCPVVKLSEIGAWRRLSVADHEQLWGVVKRATWILCNEC